MLHEAIFLATCHATFSALLVARKNSRVTPHFAIAIVTLRVARNVVTKFCQNKPIRTHLSLAGDFRHLVCYYTRCKLRKKLPTCDTPSAT